MMAETPGQIAERDRRNAARQAKRTENLAQCVNDQERFAEEMALQFEERADGMEGLYDGWLAKGITKFSAQPIYEIALKVSIFRDLANEVRRPRYIRMEAEAYRATLSPGFPS